MVNKIRNVIDKCRPVYVLYTAQHFDNHDRKEFHHTFSCLMMYRMLEEYVTVSAPKRDVALSSWLSIMQFQVTLCPSFSNDAIKDKNVFF